MAHFLIALVALAFTAGAAMAQQTHTYSKAVQQACASDYHKHGPCGGTAYRRPALTLWSMLARSARRRLNAEKQAVADPHFCSLIKYGLERGKRQLRLRDCLKSDPHQRVASCTSSRTSSLIVANDKRSF